LAEAIQETNDRHLAIADVRRLRLAGVAMGFKEVTVQVQQEGDRLHGCESAMEVTLELWTQRADRRVNAAFHFCIDLRFFGTAEALVHPVRLLAVNGGRAVLAAAHRAAQRRARIAREELSPHEQAQLREKFGWRHRRYDTQLRRDHRLAQPS